MATTTTPATTTKITMTTTTQPTITMTTTKQTTTTMEISNYLPQIFVASGKWWDGTAGSDLSVQRLSGCSMGSGSCNAVPVAQLGDPIGVATRGTRLVAVDRLQ